MILMMKHDFKKRPLGEKYIIHYRYEYLENKRGSPRYSNLEDYELRSVPCGV